MTAAAREGRTLEKPPVLHGANLLYASHSTLPLLSPKKRKSGSFQPFVGLKGVSTLYFLCGDKALFTSCLVTNPIQQTASPGPHLTCSVQGCSHQEGSSGAARKS